jgi:hypothetical protein
MQGIVAGIDRVSSIMNDIVASSREQASGIAQVNQAIAEMDASTQQNAALVEESAAATRAMQEQSLKLQELVAVFQVEAAAARLPPPCPAGVTRARRLAPESGEVASSGFPCQHAKSCTRRPHEAAVHTRPCWPASSASDRRARRRKSPSPASAPSAEVRKFIKVDAPLLALAHVRVIDGTGAPALEDRTVILRGGRIEAVLDAAAPLPAGAQVLDLRGRTVLPGLVGMHNHLMYTASINLDEDDKIPPPGFFVTEIAFSAPRMYLAAGVTTMRTTGSVEPYTDLNIRRLVDAGQIPGPAHRRDRPLPRRQGQLLPADDGDGRARTGAPDGEILGRRRRDLVQGLHEHPGRRAGAPPSLKPTSTAPD